MLIFAFIISVEKLFDDATVNVTPGRLWVQSCNFSAWTFARCVCVCLSMWPCDKLSSCSLLNSAALDSTTSGDPKCRRMQLQKLAE